MPNITEREFEACYDVGKRFYAEEISREDAIIELVSKYQMNKDSAEMYIQFFRYGMKGEKTVPPISTDGLEYYLKNVLDEFGKEQLEIFLEGLKKHIEYRQGNGDSVISFRDLYNKYSEKIGLSQRL